MSKEVRGEKWQQRSIKRQPAQAFMRSHGEEPQGDKKPWEDFSTVQLFELIYAPNSNLEYVGQRDPKLG